MKIVLTGSIAYDYLMHFPGTFEEHIIPEMLDRISLSFLVDSMIRRRGGIAANIAYTMALLGEQPKVFAAVGQDFNEYRQLLENHGVDTSAIQAFDDVFTASFFVTTDDNNAQIASFYPGAMAKSTEMHLTDLDEKPDLVLISPSDPAAMQMHINECIELGIPYVYDPSQQTVRLDPEDLEHGILNCHALFSNDYEFGLITEKTGLSLANLRERLGFIVTTRGADGADIYTRDEYVHIPVVSNVNIVEPTGLGDAFRSGFFKGLMNGLSYERCGQLGAVAATFCLEHEGPQGHEFDLTTFVARFREHFDDEGNFDTWL